MKETDTVRVHVSEMIDRLIKKNRRWDEEKRIGQVGYDEATDTVCFYHADETPNDRERYWIEFRYLKTPKGQMEWLNHIRTKGWLDGKMLNDFLDVLEAKGVLARGVSLSTEEEEG